MDNQLIIELVKVLSGSPSAFLSIILAAILLKRYVINGSFKRFLDIKEQEIKILSCLEGSLLRIISEQEKLLEVVEKK